MTDTKPSFFTQMRGALGARVDQTATNFLDLMAEDFVMEFPYARPGMPARVEGRGAVATYLSALSEGLVVDALSDLVIHETTDPEVVILEFKGSGHFVKSGEPYNQSYISVIRARGGRIVHWKDYWNPIEGLKGKLGTAAVEAFLASEPTAHDGQ